MTSHMTRPRLVDLPRTRNSVMEDSPVSEMNHRVSQTKALLERTQVEGNRRRGPESVDVTRENRFLQFVNKSIGQDKCYM